MKKILYTLIFILGAGLFSSCELDLQESPNNLSPEDANPDFLLNNVQLSFRNTYNGFHGIGS